MSFKTAAEKNEEQLQLAAVLGTAMNKWLSFAARFAVSCNDPSKLNDLCARIEVFKNGITKSDFMEIGKYLKTEKIIDDYSELKDIDQYALKRMIPHHDMYNKLESIFMYTHDRMGRLKQFLDETNHYKVNSEFDIFKIYDGIQDAIVHSRMKNVCACLANEAACIGRNIKDNNTLKHKNQLNDRCRQIVSQCVLKSRSLSV